jgi:filamentous hemagglutinin family protein
MNLFLFRFSILFYLSLVSINIKSRSTMAQIIPDSSLGVESSTVRADTIKNLPSDVIGGGAIRGGNLFHSFREFNVREGRGAYFTNPEIITNIFTRITGGNISHILGRLGVLGNANLFVINPHGIVFGLKASLDMRGAFIGSTAESLIFNDQFEFSTTNPTTPPLLTVNMPIGFRFREKAGDISSQAHLSNFGDLTLQGGNLQLSGSLESGGNIILSAIDTLTIRDSKISLLNNQKIEQNIILSSGKDTFLTNSSEVNVRGERGGNVIINAQNITLSEASKIRAGIDSELGAVDLQAGDVIINARGILQLTDSSFISNSLLPEKIGNAGNVFIDVHSLILRNNAQINSVVFDSAKGNAGLVKINASEDIEIDQNSGILSSIDVDATGASRGIELKAGAIIISNNSRLEARNSGMGNAGSIVIDARDLVSIDNSSIFSNRFSSSTGNSGNINIYANSISLINAYQDASNLGRGNGGDVILVADQGAVLLKNSDISTITPQQGGISGNINITARLFSMTDGSDLSTFSRGGSAGDVTIIAPESVTLAQDSNINVFGLALAKSGDILINTGKLRVLNGSDIQGSVEGNQPAGNLLINASKLVEVSGAIESAQGLFSPSSLTMSTLGDGNAGNIVINTKRLVVQEGAVITTQVLSNLTNAGNGGTIMINASDAVEVIGATPDSLWVSRISSDTSGSGEGGNILINTGKFILNNGATVSSFSLGSGQGGEIEINATDFVEIKGTRLPFNIFSSSLDTAANGTGNAGNIRISTGQLRVLDGGKITTETSNIGEGGDIAINASNLAFISGTSSKFISIPSQLSTSTSGQGNAGRIILSTPELIIDNNGEIEADAKFNSSGLGGDIKLTTNLLALNNARINSATQGTGKAGNIILNSSLVLSEQGVVSVNSQGEGDGGNISLTSQNLRLHNRSQISATTASGEGGNLTLNVSDTLRQQQQSPISATAAGTGNGGNITINTQFLIGTGNSDITANAFQGNGGNISINAQGIFRDLRSEITASSELGVDGIVDTNTPDVDPSRGLVELPLNLVDPNRLIAKNACRQSSQSEFTVRGKGGLPASPSQTQSSDEVTVGLVAASSTNPEASQGYYLGESKRKIVPAQGWQKNARGEIVLVAQPTTNTVNRTLTNTPECSAN